MLSFILAIPLLAIAVFCITKIVIDCKNYGGQDYMGYFQENEKKG